MALGPGKYDQICTKVREEYHAAGAVVMIFLGDLGDGFSVQAPPELAAHLPRLLRHMAQQIEDSFKEA
jgi:hypothetical protein